MHRLSAAVRCMGLKGLPVSLVHITKDGLARNAERSPWLRRVGIGLGLERRRKSRNAAQGLPHRPAIFGPDAGSATQAQQPDPHRDP